MKVSNVKSTFDSIVFEWDKNKTDFQNIHDFVIVFLDVTDPHDKLRTRILEHTLRAMNNAVTILKKEVADKEVVMISLLLHDIGKTLCSEDHNLISFRLAELLLNKYNVLPNKRKKILDCVLYHSAKNLESLDLNPELKVLMDADIIDEIGILLIAKMCLRTPDKNISINKIINSLESKYNKVEKETSYLKTKTGSDLYIKRKKKFRDYIDQLKMESVEYKL